MGYEFFVPLGHKLPYELIVRDEYIYIYICFDYQIEKMKAR